MTRIQVLTRRFTVFVALVALVWASFSMYRVHAATEAARILPSAEQPIWLPAGTAINAEIRNRIPSSATVGDTVTAFVSTPVVLNHEIVIPAGAPINGTIQSVTVHGSTGRIRMKFTALAVGRRSLPIQAPTVIVRTPLRSDLEVLGTAVNMLFGTTFGAAIGAATGDIKMIDDGVIQGAEASEPDDEPVNFRVILSSDLSG